MPPELLYALIQFQHPKKLVRAIPGGTELPDSAIAALFGLELEPFLQIQQNLKNTVLEAAKQLLTDQDFAARVDSLPFKSGQTIIGLGDSITDDSCSWLELLRVLLKLQRPTEQFNIINAGISGDTTVHVLSRFANLLPLEPDWIMTLIGTNDARTHGAHNKAPLVADTARNLETLRTWMMAKTKATRVWLTPPRVIEAKIAAFGWFASSETMWYNTHLEQIAAQVRLLPDLVVDTQAALGENPDYLLPDGLHPNLAGQIEMVKAVVQSLNTISPNENPNHQS